MHELIQEAYKKAVAADEVWSRNLQAKFGGSAGDMRYTKAGRAVDRYEEWQKANDRWLTLLASDREGKPPTSR